MSTWIAALANVLHLYRQPFPVKESLWLTALLPFHRALRSSSGTSVLFLPAGLALGHRKRGQRWNEMLRSHQVS